MDLDNEVGLGNQEARLKLGNAHIRQLDAL